MSPDDYLQLQDEVFEEIREFRFILALKFQQRTEEASLILNLINQLDTEEKKVVLLSRILAYYKDRIDEIIERVKNG